MIKNTNSIFGFKCLVMIVMTMTSIQTQAQKVLIGLTSTEVFKKQVNSDSIVKVANVSATLGSLIQASDGKLYAITRTGGTGGGTLVKIDLSTNQTTLLYSFLSNNSGVMPHGGNLNEYSPGKLIGMTSSGGTGNGGCIFTYDIVSKVFTKKLDLAFANAPRNQTLLQVGNGVFYYYSFSGGTNSKGAIMKYTLSNNTLTNVFSFSDGKYPYFRPVLGSDGKLYGILSEGGTTGAGMIFSYNLNTNTYTNLANFRAGAFPDRPGAFPYGLLEVSPGVFYGNCAFGGMLNKGTIFKFVTNGNVLTKEADFDNPALPYSSPIMASNGKLYGTTAQGGSGKATMYEFDTASKTIRICVDFAQYNKFNSAPSQYLEMIETCDVPHPYSELKDTSFLCEYDAQTFPKASSCDGDIIATCNTQFPLRTPGNHYLVWTYDDGKGNFSTQSHFVNILPIDSSIRYENGKLWANQEGVTYQWVDVNNGNNPVQGANSQSFAPQDSGKYACYITYKTCSVYTHAIDLKRLNVNQLSIKNTIQVYPNPSSDFIHVLSQDPIIQLELYDLQGRLLKIYEMEAATDVKIDIMSFNAGTYLLKVITNNSISINQIIKN